MPLVLKQPAPPQGDRIQQMICLPSRVSDGSRFTESAMKKCLCLLLVLLLGAAAMPTSHAQTLVEYDIRNLIWNGSPVAPTAQAANVSGSTITVTGPAAFDTNFWAGSPENMFLSGWSDSLNLSQNYYEFSISADAGYTLSLSGIQVGVATEQASDDPQFAGPTTYRLYASTTGSFDASNLEDEAVVPNLNTGSFQRAVLSASWSDKFNDATSVTFRVYGYGSPGIDGGGGIANINDAGFQHGGFNYQVQPIGGSTSNVIISGVAAPAPPAVTTTAATGITATSAVLGGNVTAQGGSAVTARGIVWGISANPTLANTVVVMDSGTGVFSGTVSSLPPNMTIHYRAYATNTQGTAYGANTTFSTPATVPDAPTIGTATAGDAQVSVAFTAPPFNGGSTITSYTVTSSPGGHTGSGTSSPITVTSLDNGTAYTFTVTATNSAGESAASAASNSVTPMGEQTITFTNPGAQNFGTAPTLSGTASSGLPVSFTSTTEAVCTITAGGALTFVTPGTCTINANQAGNAEYNPAPQVQHSFSVNASVPDMPTMGTAVAGNGQASVSFTAPAVNGGAAIIQYTATSNPGGFTGTRADAEGPITVSGLANGTEYTFTVTATNSAGNSAASTVSNAVTPMGEQTITFANPGPQNFGTTPTLSATASSGLSVSFTSATEAVCTVTAGGALTFVTPGTCTIHADQPGSAAFEPALRVTRTFDVNAVVPGAPTIGTATAGDAQAEVSFTPPASDGGEAITSYTVTSVPGGLTGTGAASPITVTGLSNGTEYTFAVTATNGIGTGAASAASNAVTPRASQTITFTQPAEQNFGTNPQLVATANSGLDVEFSSHTPEVCTITTPGVLTFVTAGSCTINADQPGNAAYLAATQVQQSFTVNAVVPGAPTIGVATAGDQSATVSFTAPAFTGGDTISNYTVISQPGGITGTGSASPITVSGLVNGTAYTFTVTASNGAGTGDASAQSNSITPKGNQVITFTDPGEQDYRNPPTLTATTSSGLQVSFSADAGTLAVCDITAGGVLSFHATGSCTIHADQTGNDAFNPAIQVSHTFEVLRVNLAPVLTIASPAAWLRGAAAVRLDNAAEVSDWDLDALNSGNGDYTGASLLIQREGGIDADDLLSVVGNDTLSVTGGAEGGGTISATGNVIAIIADTGTGFLQLTFQDNGTVPTRALVLQVLRAIHYRHSDSNGPATIVLQWTFNDGNSGANEQGTGGELSDTITQTVNISLPSEPDDGDVGDTNNIIDTTTSVNSTSGTITITPSGVVSGGTLGGTILNNGEIAGEVILVANTTVNGGTISGKITGDAGQPALITNGLVKEGAELSNVIIGANTVLEPGVILGPNVKFESLDSIPTGIDLTTALKSITWLTGDERRVVDLSDDVLAASQGQAPIPLIASIRLITDLSTADVSQTQSGEVVVVTEDSQSAVLPVSISRADPDMAEGTYINDDGDVVLVTGNLRVVIAYPALVDQSAFTTALETMGLQLAYDSRANLMVSLGGQNSNPMALSVSSYYSGRPAVVALPAQRGTQPGLAEYPIPGLGAATGLSLIFENESGRLMEQELVPVPADWPTLRDTIATMPGISHVAIGTDGVIIAVLNGAIIRGRVGFMVLRGADHPRDSLLLTPTSDISGNGIADYEITYPNGDRQMLFIFAAD